MVPARAMVCLSGNLELRMGNVLVFGSDLVSDMTWTIHRAVPPRSARDAFAGLPGHLRAGRVAQDGGHVVLRAARAQVHRLRGGAAGDPLPGHTNTEDRAPRPPRPPPRIT